jgi:hypothetical protein
MYTPLSVPEIRTKHSAQSEQHVEFFNVKLGGYNEELNDLYFLPNIVRVVKWRRMRWAGHVARMGRRGVDSVLVGKLARGANFQDGPAVSMRSQLLVAHEKLGQLPLLTVYVVPV